MAVVGRAHHDPVEIGAVEQTSEVSVLGRARVLGRGRPEPI